VGVSEGGLLVNLALLLVAAALGGAIAVRLGQSAIIGYIAAGVLVGPYTPGPVGEAETVTALADIGVIFLLFVVGLELSVRDLLRVGRVAVAGAALQIVALLAIGYLVALALGFTPIEAAFFGAFVSNSSSTVIAKVMGERGETDAEHGHVAIAWSTVQDLSTVVLVVVLTVLAGGGELGSELLFGVGRALLFIVIVLPLGLRVLPFIFERVALLRSREVFVMAVVAIALATAWASEQFGLSLALGAFIAGLLIGESDISHQIVGELSPLRDVFAGLFFVSIGMLIDPAFVINSLPLVLLAVLVVVPLKGALSAAIGWLLRLPPRTAVLAGMALAQSAEFSFVLARVGVTLGVVGQSMFSLMLAAAGASILLAPSLHRGVPAALRSIDRRYAVALAQGEDAAAVDVERPAAVVIVGYGRVGRLIGDALERRGFRYLVMEVDPRVCRRLRERGVPVVQGPAENPYNLARAGLDRARVLVVAVDDPIALRQVVHHARRENSRLLIVARARSSADREFLQREGVTEIVTAELELAIEMARFTLARLGVSAAETGAIVAGLRRRGTGSGGTPTGP
jgi:monovalent cation:H+ antiporter-2, CPA2 family